MTTIHTRQLQQYTQDNYNNTHKTTTTIHTRKLQQYTQDNYNNTHKTKTIHTRQLQQYTQNNYNNTHKTTSALLQQCWRNALEKYISAVRICVGIYWSQSLIRELSGTCKSEGFVQGAERPDYSRRYKLTALQPINTRCKVFAEKPIVAQLSQ